MIINNKIIKLLKNIGLYKNTWQKYNIAIKECAEATKRLSKPMRIYYENK